MTDIQFRQASTADAAEILALKRTAIHELTGDAYEREQRDAWAPGDDALPSFEAAIDSERFVVLLAVSDGKAVGYGVLNVSDEAIDAAYVHPDHARDGIATSLIRQLEMSARMHGIAELDIVSSLNATAFYESLGYWQVGAKTRTIDGVDIDFAVLCKHLDAT